MTSARFALSCAGLLLLCLLGAGFYCYQNLPSILQQQTLVYLQEYGVQDLLLGQLHFSDDQLSTDRLWLRGERDGLMFEATLSSLDLDYDWRRLLKGQLQTINLSDLNISIVQIAAGTEPAPAVVTVENLLPQALIAQLPVQSLKIKQWSLDYRSNGAPPIAATGNLLLTDQLSLQLETTHLESRITTEIWTAEESPYLNARVSLSDGKSFIGELRAQLERASPDDWRWVLQGELDYAPALAWLHKLALNPELALSIPALEDLRLSGNCEFSAQVTHPESLDVSTAAELPLLEQPMLSRLSVNIHLENDIVRLDYPAIIEAVAGNLDISVALEAGQLELTVEPTDLTGQFHTQQLSLPQDTQRWLHWEKTVPVQWQSSAQAKIASAVDNSWSLQLRDSLLVLGNKNSELRWEGLKLDTLIYPEDQAQLSTQLSAQIKTRLRKQQLPQMELALRHEGPLEKSDFSLSLADTAESMSLGLEATVNLSTGNGNYSLSARSLDLPYAASTVLPLMQKFGLLQEDVEVVAGKIALSSELKSGGFDIASLQQQSQLLVQNLSGSYGEYQFEGMALNAGWSGIDQWKTRQSVEFSLDKLNVGFELADIQARVSLPEDTPIVQPTVSIERFSAGMFGGRLYLPQPRRWDFGGETNTLTLRAEGWQLADIVALQEGRDIQARGVLEGELPVTIRAGRVIIEKGYLRALAPGGSIRYIANEASKALAISSPELGLALDLLSDFRYETLSSDVELDRDGNLLLGLSLAGKNPARYEGRQINFNINLEQNIDPLLQSLRLSDKLVEQIEGRLH